MKDIMSCTFDLTNLFIFTGGVDGTLIAWNLDTGFARYYLHENDNDPNNNPCTCDNYVSASKSVDALVIMEKHRILISMTADQYLRFWYLDDMQSQRGPILKYHAGHHNPVADDQLTGIAVTVDNTRFVTTDTSGRIKMHDISRIKNFMDPAET